MAWSVVFITISGMLVILQGGTMACPGECTCSTISKGFLVDCSSQKLNQVPEGLPENVTILDFSMNTLGGTPLAKYQLQPLANLTILDELWLQFNNIQLIYADAFPTLTTTRHLVLANNNLTSVPSQALASLPNLQYLDMSSNRIMSVDRKAFLNQYLREVILRDNLVHNINVDAFEGLSNLISLSLQENDITNVADAFRHLHNLQNLNLSYNSLQEINKDIFAQNLHLKTVNLDNNDVGFLSPVTFANQQNLTQLSLAFNNLNSSVLDVLNFLPKLTQLFISTNEMENLPENAFISNPNLLDLDLSGNNITVIHPETFRGLTHLQTLQLNRNHLKFLPSDVFDNFPENTSLCLANNPWVCNCSIAYLQESLLRFQSSCEEPQCSDRGNLTLVVARKPLPECDISTTVSMTTAEITEHEQINTTTPADSSSGNLLIILTVIPVSIVILIVILIVICCCCTRNRQPNTSKKDKDTTYNYWTNVMSPTRWSRTSTRLQQGKEKDTEKRLSLYDRVKDIVQRPFSTVSLQKSDDYGQRTAGLSMETYLEASSNAPKDTNSYHQNTIIGMETVMECDSEVTNEATMNLPEEERGGLSQKDTLDENSPSTSEEKNRENEK